MKHPKDNLLVLAFKSAEKWEEWLAKNFTLETGIWLRMFKKASGKATVTYKEALDVALCYGWIDGLMNKFDEESFMQKFTPRRTRSLWSKKNIENIARLTAAGKMKESGIREVDRAKEDGRWDAAYSSPANMVLPEDLKKALRENKEAKAFFETLNKTNKYAMMWRLATAVKPETRIKRLNKIMEMLKNRQKYHQCFLLLMTRFANIDFHEKPFSGFLG